MTLEELKDKLYQYNVPERWYSLDEGLKSDAYIVSKNHSFWEVFYTERGEQHDFQVFISEEEAYDYLWKKMESQLRVFKIQPRY